MKWTREKLIDFEKQIITLFESGKARCPIHLCGGNEDQLLSIFDNIKKRDYVFSTHRSTYHYLLKGGSPRALLDEIQGKTSGICKGNGRAMNVYDKSINFYSSAIVGGNAALAVGVGLVLKKKKRKTHVWVFMGDGAEDTGRFIEACRFSLARSLPLTFIIEDNDRSVNATKKDRWHNYLGLNSLNIIRYEYERVYPHVGIGKHVSF